MKKSEVVLLKPVLLASNSRWAVVNKPAGWLTIPGSTPLPTDRILAEWMRKEVGPVWVVHRLDQETSGIVLFARSAEAHREVSLWFQNRDTQKVYVCLAQGRPELPILKLNSPIRGTPSLTQVEVKEQFKEGFFAHVIPRTGRRHQIRIHLSEQGFPLWGDSRYGGPKQIEFTKEAPLSVKRVALHASRLRLPSGEQFDAELPEDFQNWLAELRKKGSHV